jgi:hypothetical protein
LPLWRCDEEADGRIGGLEAEEDEPPPDAVAVGFISPRSFFFSSSSSSSSDHRVNYTQQRSREAMRGEERESHGEESDDLCLLFATILLPSTVDQGLESPSLTCDEVAVFGHSTRVKETFLKFRFHLQREEEGWERETETETERQREGQVRREGMTRRNL